MNIYNILHSLQITKVWSKEKCVFFEKQNPAFFVRLPIWDHTDLQRTLLNNVMPNKSKIKKFQAWLKDMRKKEQTKLNSKNK